MSLSAARYQVNARYAVWLPSDFNCAFLTELLVISVYCHDWLLYI